MYFQEGLATGLNVEYKGKEGDSDGIKNGWKMKGSCKETRGSGF